MNKSSFSQLTSPKGPPIEMFDFQRVVFWALLKFLPQSNKRYNGAMAILNENEYVDVEGRGYINPQVALDEANSFIDNLRATQQANNQQIQTDTYNLGTEISSNLGGLTSPVGPNGAGGAGLSYFTSRYQTPQTNAAVSELRSAAQAQALNQVLANEQAKWKKRYQDAYRNYQKRASSGSGGGSGVTGGTQSGTLAGQGDVTTTVTDDELEARGALNISGDDISRGGRYMVSPDFNRYGGHDIIWITPQGKEVTIPQLSDGSYVSTNIPTLLRNLGLTRFTDKG